MSDFSDRPFTAGTLTGLRAFTLDSLGRLRAPQQDTIWQPGENVAECRRADQFAVGRPFGGGYIVSGVGLSEAAVAKLGNWHRPGSLSCGCGFHAYTNGDNDYHRLDGTTVQAVVEGYGLTTVGSRGFRSEKARLVALIAPKRRRFRSAVGDQLMLGVNITFLAGSPVYIGAMRRQRYPQLNLTQTLRLYPDVPVYPTVASALKAHPLSTPPEPERPTPENREDFWTNMDLRA